MIASWLASHWYWFIGAGVLLAVVTQPALAWRFKWQIALAAAIALAVMQWMAADSLRKRLENLQLTSALERHRLEAAARATERKRVDDMAALDARLTKENTDALLAKDGLIADLRAGALRVRNDRKCPASGSAQAGASTGSGHGAEGVYLPPEAQERVLRIGAEADDVVRQLTACQAVIRLDRGQQ